MERDAGSMLLIAGGLGAVVGGLRVGGAAGGLVALGGAGLAAEGVRRFGEADGHHRPLRPMPPLRDPAEFVEWKDTVQEASEESFPASDPPAFTPTHIGKVG